MGSLLVLRRDDSGRQGQRVSAPITELVLVYSHPLCASRAWLQRCLFSFACFIGHIQHRVMALNIPSSFQFVPRQLCM